MSVVVIVELARPTVWQKTSRAVYGPFESAQDPRIDRIVLRAGPLGENAHVTVIPLDPPERALTGSGSNPGEGN